MVLAHTKTFRPWLLVSAAWFGPAALAAFEAYMQGRLGMRPPVSWRSLVWQSGDWLIYGALTPLVFHLARRLPLRRGVLTRNISIHFAASLGLCLVWAVAGAILRSLVIEHPDGELSMAFVVSWSLTTLPFGVAVYFALLGIEHAMFYFLEARERETQAARLSAQLAEARLGALRMQIHPHFLFNSLNAITVLVRDQDTRTATRMLEELGEVLHRVLRTDRRHEVPLAEEIEFLERYLALEQMRFSDRLRPTIDIDPATRDAAVPDMILQPLVENALRHGVAKRTEAGLVAITARREGGDLVVVVEDDGPGPTPESVTSPERGGVGLANTRERLATLYGDRARLELSHRSGGGAVATLRLPYRELAPVPGPTGV